MSFKKTATRLLALLALGATQWASAQTTLLNASYDVAREFYNDLAPEKRTP